jgi:hypothetical protein
MRHLARSSPLPTVTTAGRPHDAVRNKSFALARGSPELALGGRRVAKPLGQSAPLFPLRVKLDPALGSSAAGRLQANAAVGSQRLHGAEDHAEPASERHTAVCPGAPTGTGTPALP